MIFNHKGILFTIERNYNFAENNLTMKFFALIFSSLFTFSIFGQDVQKIKSPTSFFPIEKTKVLVVGTFHFDYPNLDINKTEDSNKIDVLKEPKKSEVTELVDYIKEFKPTKIALEAFPIWNAFEKLNNYKQGQYRSIRDERYQLGLRIASELNLDTIYSIDATSFDEDLMKIDSAYLQKMFIDFDFKSDDSLVSMFYKWFNYEDGLPGKMNLLDYFKRSNSRTYHRLGYGAYLVGDFKLDSTRGADILSIWWYNRNLRIFRKLQDIKATKEDRILIIFGNGHASILRQLLESSPEFEFVEFNGLK